MPGFPSPLITMSATEIATLVMSGKYTMSALYSFNKRSKQRYKHVGEAIKLIKKLRRNKSGTDQLNAIKYQVIPTQSSEVPVVWFGELIRSIVGYDGSQIGPWFWFYAAKFDWKKNFSYFHSERSTNKKGHVITGYLRITYEAARSLLLDLRDNGINPHGDELTREMKLNVTYLLNKLYELELAAHDGEAPKMKYRRAGVSTQSNYVHEHYAL